MDGLGLSAIKGLWSENTAKISWVSNVVGQIVLISLLNSVFHVQQRSTPSVNKEEVLDLHFEFAHLDYIIQELDLFLRPHLSLKNSFYVINYIIHQSKLLKRQRFQL